MDENGYPKGAMSYAIIVLGITIFCGLLALALH
jgi:hypothetical protein